MSFKEQVDELIKNLTDEEVEKLIRAVLDKCKGDAKC